MKVGDIVRRILRSDVPGAPAWVDGLLAPINRLSDGLVQLLTSLTLTDNTLCDVVAVKATHGVEVPVKLTRLRAAFGGVILSCDGALPAHPQPLVRMKADGSCGVTVFFNSTSARDVPLTLLLLPEGGSTRSIPAFLPPPPSGGTAGQVLTKQSDGSMAWAAAAVGGTAVNRRIGAAFASPTAANTVRTYGFDVAPTLIGPNGNLFYTRQASILLNPAVANPCSVAWAAETRINFSPKLSQVTGHFLQNVGDRVFSGLASAAVNFVPALAGGATASSFVLVAFDSSVSANWLIVSGDGANFSTLDTGVAATANMYDPAALGGAAAPSLEVIIDLNTALATVTAYSLDGQSPEVKTQIFSKTKATNLPAQNVLLGPLMLHFKNGATATFGRYFGSILEQNL